MRWAVAVVVDVAASERRTTSEVASRALKPATHVLGSLAMTITISAQRRPRSARAPAVYRGESCPRMGTRAYERERQLSRQTSLDESQKAPTGGYFPAQRPRRYATTRTCSRSAARCQLLYRPPYYVSPLLLGAGSRREQQDVRRRP